MAITDAGTGMGDTVEVIMVATEATTTARGLLMMRPMLMPSPPPLTILLIYTDPLVVFRPTLDLGNLFKSTTDYIILTTYFLRPTANIPRDLLMLSPGMATT